MGYWLIPSCSNKDTETHKKVLVYAMIGAMVATGVMAVWATIGAASVAAGLLSMFTGVMQNSMAKMQASLTTKTNVMDASNELTAQMTPQQAASAATGGYVGMIIGNAIVSILLQLHYYYCAVKYVKFTTVEQSDDDFKNAGDATAPATNTLE